MDILPQKMDDSAAFTPSKEVVIYELDRTIIRLPT